MSGNDRWLLPDGIEDILPDRAYRVERLRRRLLDLYHAWGYDLVVPPLAEFTESLFSGSGSDSGSNPGGSSGSKSSSGSDLDLMTFKITDQLSGRMMGVRADMTPQVARMDAHSLRRDNPSRFCYAGQILYTRPRSALESRSPIQVGVELFGEARLGADREVIRLLVESLTLAGVGNICLDLGHVSIYRSIEQSLGLDVARKGELFDLIQQKDASLPDWVSEHIADSASADMLVALPTLCGDVSVLTRAEQVLSGAPEAARAALAELQAVIEDIQQDCPGLEIFLDLAELRAYHYHTGIVFSAYGGGSPVALGHGGRYDRVGEQFGRARPATGFGLDLGFLVDLIGGEEPVADGIYVPAPEIGESSPKLLEELEKIVAELRSSGQRVVCGFPGQEANYRELSCDRVLVYRDDGFQIQAISDARESR